jgi:hypothetical protein
VYIIPVLNMSASAFISRVNSLTPATRSYKLLQRLFIVGVYVGFIVSFMAAGFGVYVSRLNYPGGEAIQAFNRLGGKSVHIDSYNAGNGVCLFYYANGTLYSKDEGINRAGELEFEYLIREWMEDVREDWSVEKVVEGYDGLRIKSVNEIIRGYKWFIAGKRDVGLILPVEVKTTPKSMILKRK